MFDPNPIKQYYIDHFKHDFNEYVYLRLVQDKKENKKVNTHYITSMMVWKYTKRGYNFWANYYAGNYSLDHEFWVAVTEIGLFMGMTELPLDVDFNFKKFENTEYEKLFT